ncbi:hypothetical protein PVAND_005519 [Polypedilum vanderplanki]|uniref:Bromo domain-containing protein n=1 Tax=Polypedilum vanderplanki TaxID=319348 RepID=A0A9J6C0R4_POLVA|nr:hypothetical protein PVAND_005519 [Polypedilum vanderplanki]
MNFIEIQTWPEIPQIAFFSSLFSQSFRLPEFDIEDLEEALLLDSSENNTICNPSLSVEFTPRLIPELIVSLLKGCDSVVQSWPNITTSNYQMFLRRVFRHKCEEHNIENPFNTDVDFHSLPLRTKVEILNYLCEFRLDSSDVEVITNKFEADSLRIKPLGYDSNDSIYWYFFGTRLYREDIVKSKSNKLEHIWQVICFTEEDWHSLANKFKSSKSRKEQNLYKCLIQDFLPNIPLIFKAKEAERRRRLFQRRSSQRVKSLLEQQQKSIYDPSFDTVASNESESIKLSLTEKFLNDKKQELEAKKQLQDKIQQDRAKRAQRRDYSKSSEEESANSNLTILSHSKSDEFDSISTNPSNSRSNKENIFISDHDNQPFALLRATEPLEIITMPPVSSKLPGRQTNNSLSSITGNIVIQQTPHNTSSSTTSSSTTAASAATSSTTTTTASTAGRKKKTKANLYMETDEVLQIGMHKVLQYVKNHDDAWPFMDPVEEEIAPKYYSIIKRPMDLLKMEEKLDNGEYLTYTEFRTDFKLIVNNCRLYNGQNNEYTQMVNNLQIAFDRATKKYFDQSSSDEEQQVLLEYPPVLNTNNTSNSSSSNKGKRKHDHTDDHKSESKSMKHEKKGTQAIVSDNVKKKKSVEKLKKKHKTESTPKSEQKKKKDKKIEEEIVSDDEIKLDQSKTSTGVSKKKKVNNNGSNSAIIKEKVKAPKDHKNKVKHKEKSEKPQPKSSQKKSEKVQNSKKHESKKSKSSTVKEISADFDSSSDESIKDLINESFTKVSHKKSKEKQSNKNNNTSEKSKKNKKNQQKHTNDKFDSLFDDFDKLKNRREKSPTVASMGSHITDNSFGEFHSIEIKDKFDLIKERRNQDKSPTKQPAQTTAITIVATPTKNPKPQKSKEKISKKSKLPPTEEKTSDKEIKSSKSKQQNAPIPAIESKKNFKQKATLDVLDLETEQTLKDINKWLEHTPRFEYNSESNSPSRYTIDDMDVHLKVDPNDFRKPTPLPLSPSTSKKPFQTSQKNNADGASKEPSLLDKAANALSKTIKKLSKKKVLGDKHQLMIKKKEVQRTTNRLQPGKTKGNLLCNLQNNNASSANNSNNNDELGSKEKLKETKNSLITEIHENSPQLSLGKVLDPNAFNFSSSNSALKEEAADILGGGGSTTAASADEDEGNDDIELSTKVKSDNSDSSPSERTTKKEPQENSNVATSESTVKPNLSAWFKAFGVSKKPNNADMKKGTEKNDNYNASCSLQRRMSTGSSVSEISSIEDSPHHSNLEDKSGVPIYSSPPIQRSPVTPRNDQLQKGNYQESVPIRVGFYQDTTSTKSSPEKSCSPHETLTSSSSYQNYSQQSNAFPNQNSNNLNVYSNFYNPQESPKLRQSPLYEQYKQDYNLEANMNKSISSNVSPSSSHQSQQSSPYQQQPISPYPSATESKTLNSDIQGNDSVSNTRSPSSTYSQSNSPFHQNPSSPYNNNSQIQPQITNSPEFNNNQMAHQSSIFQQQQPTSQETPQFPSNQHQSASQKPLAASNENNNSSSATPSNFALNMHQQTSAIGLANNSATLQHSSYLHNSQGSTPQAQQLNYATTDNSYLLNDPTRNKKIDTHVRPENYQEEMRRQVPNIETAHDNHPKYLDLSKQTTNRYATQYAQPVNFSQPLDLDFAAKNRAFDAISRNINIPKNNYQSSLNDCATSSGPQSDRETPKATPTNFMQNAPCDNPNIMNSHQSIKATQPSAVDVNYKQSPLFNSTPASSMMELTAFMRDFRQNDDRFSSLANPAANYYDKAAQSSQAAHMFAKNAVQSSTAGNFQQIFSNPMTTIAYGRDQQADFSSYQSRLNIFQPATAATNTNQMLPTPQAPVASKAKKPKKSKKASASPPVVNPQTSSLPPQHQLQPNQQQAHHSIVPGSAFNYGPPSLPLYGENTASYLEEFRGSQNAYYSAAMRSSETIDKAVTNTPQAHGPPPTASSPYHHLIPSHHPSRSYPFMNSLDQYRMMFNQSYQAGYHLGMHNQPPPHWYQP